jgi:cytoskeletal protein RodZ
MAEVEVAAETALFPERVGDRLRAARAKAGLDLSDIAARTRVPLRHLTAIEAGDYSALPSITYSVGFVKSYARAVGLDEADLASGLRNEMGHQTVTDRLEAQTYIDDESGPLAPRWLAWTAAAIFAVLAIGYGVFWGHWFGGAAPSEIVAPAGQPAAQPENGGPENGGPENGEVANPAPAAATNPQGEVVLTAKNAVWLRIYDANDKVLLEKEMPAGERFVVPRDANKPMVRTGRADLISVTVDGKEVAALGPAERTVKDVDISAAGLAARPAPAGANGGAIGAAPVTNPAAPAVQP